MSRVPDLAERLLFQEALTVADHAYAPYSGYAVGAVAAADGSDCLPCGMCLQALSEFGDPEIVVRSGGEVAVLRLRELLTAPFSLAQKDGADA